MNQIAFQDQVDRIAGGETFAQKAQLRSLLRILADHYQSQTLLQPTRVIRELWPDDESRESKDLAAAMYRLRHALADYYAGEGASDSVLISLPRRAGETAGEGGFRQWIIAEVREPPKITGAACAVPSTEPGEVGPAQFQPPTESSPVISAGPIASHRTIPSVRWLTTAIAAVIVLLVASAYLLHINRLNSHRQPSRSLVIAGGLRPIPVPDAEQLYLRGRYFWNLRTADGLAKAIDFYTQAIVKDPEYAEAYAGLAETYELLPQFGHADFADSLAKAENAADRAIALDPNLAVAHNAKAFALFYRDWDIAGSDAEFQRALALDPNSARTHHWYASTLENRMEGSECMKQIDEALRLDPTSASIAADAALFEADFGDPDAGIKALKEIEQTQPTLVSPPVFLGAIDFARGDFPSYIAEVRRYAAITHNLDDVALADAIARGWARAGKTGLLEGRSRALKMALDHGSIQYVTLGKTLLLLGRQEEALSYFRAGLSHRDLGLVEMLQLPWARQLAGVPGYAALFAQVHQRVHMGDLQFGQDIPVSQGLPW
jgi:tetratricopeptide (TPR) repeat protein